jgi:hypothetical protein
MDKQYCVQEDQRNRIQKKNKELRQKNSELDCLNKEKTGKVDRQIHDIEILTRRLDKIKKRKRFDPTCQVCRKCNKAYEEKDNFNWSCRMHRSEWGGTMWWCCGKTQLHALGCNARKHSPMKDGESEEEELDNAENKKRCYVCREKGHEAADCLKDPNMRTTHNP